MKDKLKTTIIGGLIMIAIVVGIVHIATGLYENMTEFREHVRTLKEENNIRKYVINPAISECKTKLEENGITDGSVYNYKIIDTEVEDVILLEYELDDGSLYLSIIHEDDKYLSATIDVLK